MAAWIIHILAFAGTALAGVALALAFPALTAGAPSLFATITGMATLYGLVFTIIEVFRARASADSAARSARSASEAVKALYRVRDRSECLSSIEHALEDIARNGQMSLGMLGRIVRLYAAEFPELTSAEGSVQRRNVNVLRSYALAYGPGVPTRTGRLKSTLIGMTAELAASDNGQTAVGERP